jgi:hypothetical protein
MIGFNLGLLGGGKGFEAFVFGFEALHKVFEGFLLGKSGFLGGLRACEVGGGFCELLEEVLVFF